MDSLATNCNQLSFRFSRFHLCFFSLHSTTFDHLRSSLTKTKQKNEETIGNEVIFLFRVVHLYDSDFTIEVSFFFPVLLFHRFTCCNIFTPLETSWETWFTALEPFSSTILLWSVSDTHSSRITRVLSFQTGRLPVTCDRERGEREAKNSRDSFIPCHITWTPLSLPFRILLIHDRDRQMNPKKKRRIVDEGRIIRFLFSLLHPSFFSRKIWEQKNGGVVFALSTSTPLLLALYWFIIFILLDFFLSPVFFDASHSLHVMSLALFLSSFQSHPGSKKGMKTWRGFCIARHSTITFLPLSFGLRDEKPAKRGSLSQKK